MILKKSREVTLKVPNVRAESPHLTRGGGGRGEMLPTRALSHHFGM